MSSALKLFHHLAHLACQFWAFFMIVFYYWCSSEDFQMCFINVDTDEVFHKPENMEEAMNCYFGEEDASPGDMLFLFNKSDQ